MAVGGRRAPSGRDYGCGIVALLAGLMFVATILGGVVALLLEGVSVGLLFGLLVNGLFWYWVAVGALRRTIWSDGDPSSE